MNAERIAKEAADQAARELAERNAALAKQAAEARARHEAAVDEAEKLVTATIQHFGIERDEAIELIIRAAETIQFSNEVAEAA